MKKLLAFALIFFLAGISGLSAQPRQILNFDELLNAVKEGHHVNLVFHYAKCELISDNEKKEKVPDAIGGMPLDVFEYFAPNSIHNKLGFLVASESKLIENPLGEDYVYNYVKVKIDSDGKVKISARYLNPLTMKVEMDENFFGSVNDGKNDAGVFLFIDE